MSYVSALEVTPQVVAAIQQLLRDKRWYASDLAAAVGVSPASVSKWMTGRTASIRPRIAEKLVPLIEPFLEEGALEVQSGVARYGEPLSEQAQILGMIYDKLPPAAQRRVDKYIRQEEARELRSRQ